MVNGQYIGKIRLEVEEQATYQQDGADDTGHSASHIPEIWSASNIRVGGKDTCDTAVTDGNSIDRTQPMLIVIDTVRNTCGNDGSNWWLTSIPSL